ncbi:rho GTPase-activating protein 15 isoform X5 [Halyomorpha halys]|uniref:rho GTPase-activating protein 15 isoform X5 n=1 Tax=Halyomorpha halys TaxID=286706 RepID=UPI0006D4CCBD|nr:rho GTPase-activating protein 15-like isoform X6 [Halyomorpha halys]
MCFDSVWENNPAYCCSFQVKKGLFKSLCDNALESAGMLMVQSRLAAFDSDCNVAFYGDKVDTADIPQPVDPDLFLNFILYGFEQLCLQLEAIEHPEVIFLMDEEFKQLCASAEALLDDIESEPSSLENNPATDMRASVSNLELYTTNSDSTIPLSEDDTSSESSDITAWKWDIYASAFEEYDFLIYNYNTHKSQWHSASDALGRVYYFRENSSESSWTLPTHQAPSPEPPPQAEEMAAIFSKISNIEFGPRRMRNAKAFSMMIPNKKEENEMTSSLKGWPQLSDGRMKELRGDVVVQRVICEGPLHYTKICEGGKRVRKNWTSVYVVLNDLFLLIYKDIKAYHSSRGHPEVTLDLNGAEVSSGEKVSGRKHVLLFSTQQELGHKVALQCENINSALHWATTIQHTINTLPKATESVRNAKLGMITEGTSPEDLSKKGANIGRSKSVNFKNKDDSMEDLGVSSAERQVKIKARLKKFFHKRPTMESLVKKGIWKGIFLPRAKLDKRMLILHEPVFGCYLEAACSSADSSNPKVPKFVQRCISIIERLPENMKTDGLYRASGNLSQIQKIRLQIDQNHYEILEKEEDVHVLTGALKLFFRELKEPLIPCKLFTKAIKASTTPNRKERISMFQDIVKALPPINRETLKFLLQHLLRVTQYQEHNRMHVANVAIVFGPTLMWPEQESTNMALDLMQQNMVIEALLIDYQTIFK